MLDTDSQHNILYSYTNNDSSESLANLFFRLYDQQYATWPLMQSNYDALSKVKLRTITCSSYSVTLQFNPGRIVNTTAATDTRSIAKRPCFLCSKNRPFEQKSILYQETLLVLCNPFPIFNHHFTICSTNHAPQEFIPNIEHLLSLTRSLTNQFTIFYNGPKCGASAPDHFHFQAAPFKRFPIEHLRDDQTRRNSIYSDSLGTIITLSNIGRSCIIIESSDSQFIINKIKKIFLLLQKYLHTNDEPMINIICSHSNNQWQVYIFPRAKHRPSLYFLETDLKRVISPASVDISGLLITPQKNDFNNVTSGDIEQIFSEVSISSTILNRITQEI